MEQDPEGTILAGGTEGAGTTGQPGGTEGAGTTGQPGGTEGQGTTGGKGNEGAGADGGKPKSPGWRAALKAELRDHEELKEIKDVNDLAVRFIDVNGRAKAAITKPGDKATQEELNAYYEALGRPKTKDGYRFDFTKLPEGMRQDAGFTGFLQDMSFDAGLSDAQAAVVLEKLGGRLQAGLDRVKEIEGKQAAAARTETTEYITKTFGDKAPTRIKEVDNAVNVVGQAIGLDLRPIMREGGTGNKLWVFKLFEFISSKILPDGAAPSAGTPSQGEKKGLTYPQLDGWLGNRS